MMLFAPRIANDLGPFLAVTSEDTLSLVLETLSVVVEVNDACWMTEKLAESLVLAVLDVWTKHIKGERDDLKCPDVTIWSETCDATLQTR